MVVKLTKRLVEAVEVDPAGTVQVRDAELRGFLVRVTPNGVRTYGVQYRDAAGRTRRVVIGRHGVLTAEEARERAKQLLGKVSAGENPAAERHQQRDAARRAETVTQFCDRYLTQHADSKKKASSAKQDRRMIERFIKEDLGKLPMVEVTRVDVVRLHQSLTDTPFQANRVLALCSKLFNLAERWGVRPDGSNPCRHIERYKERRRERYLSSAELAQLGAVLAAVEKENIEHRSVAPAIRLLLFTGCRKGEILGLKWEFVNWEAEKLELPESKTGKKTVEISPPSMAVLRTLWKARDKKNPWVLPGRTKGSPLVGLPHAWERIRARAGLQELRLHDLRHTFGAFGSGMGLSLRMVGSLLGHTQPQTTQRYAHIADNPRKEAAAKIGEKIAASMRGKRGRVIALPEHPRGRVKSGKPRKAAGA